MSRTDVLMVIILLLIIGVCSKNYIDTRDARETQLQERVMQQQLMIDRKNKQVQDLSQVIEVMYYNFTGQRIPGGWQYVPDKRPPIDSESPVH